MISNRGEGGQEKNEVKGEEREREEKIAGRESIKDVE